MLLCISEENTFIRKLFDVRVGDLFTGRVSSPCYLPKSN